MKIVIAGGAGFIGANLVELLLEKQDVHSIVILDDLRSCGLAYLHEVLGAEFADTGLETSINVAAGGRSVKVLVAIRDLLNPDGLVPCCAGADAVVHLAEQTPGRYSTRTSQEIQSSNLNMTRNLLRTTRRTGCSRFVYLSSFAVYGLCDSDGPINEGTPTVPTSAYGAAKLACETLCEEHAMRRGMGLAILRVANPYGKFSEHKDMVIPRMLRHILTDTELVTYGDGAQTRDFVHAADVVRAIWGALEILGTPCRSSAKTALSEGTDSGSHVYNIGSATETSVRDLIALLSRITGHDARVTSLPERRYDIRRSVADITQARDELAWEPRVGLEEGIRELFSRMKGPDEE